MQNYKKLKNSEILYDIALGQLHGIGPVRATQLLSKFGNAKTIFEMSPKSLSKETGWADKTIRHLKRDEALKIAEKQVQFNEQHTIQTIGYQDVDYPRRLKQCQDAPIVLFSKGNMNLNTAKIISVVGTRNITPYGIKIVSELIENLVGMDVLVVSGLAYGVDVLVHQLCVEKGIPTVGVLGHGLDRIYPYEHKQLAINMQENGGLLTEFFAGTKPDKENFPMRNRIVAGMADATIVVESKSKGGSIITAELANDYNRDVFAYPGDIDRVYSSGCNELIANNKAQLIVSGKDFIRQMNWHLEKTDTPPQMLISYELSKEEKLIVDQLREGPLHTDVICIRTQLNPSQLNVLLFNLELNGVVQQLPGKRYQMG